MLPLNEESIIEFYFVKYTEQTSESTPRWLIVCNDLKAAQDALTKDGFRKLGNRIGKNQGEVSRFLQIAKCNWIRQNPYWLMEFKGWSALYEISILDTFGLSIFEERYCSGSVPMKPTIDQISACRGVYNSARRISVGPATIDANVVWSCAAQERFEWLVKEMEKLPTLEFPINKNVAIIIPGATLDGLEG